MNTYIHILRHVDFDFFFFFRKWHRNSLKIKLFKKLRVEPIIMSAHWAAFCAERSHWVHPEAKPLTERSVSSCIWLAYIYFYLQWNMLIRYKSSLSAQWAVVLLDAPNGIHSFANQSIVRIIDFRSLYYRLESPLFSSNLNVTGIFCLSL